MDNLDRERSEEYLRRRWRALGAAGALFTRPWLDLDNRSAGQRVDRHGRLGPLDGKRVLCLAGGGGQQSAAFALLFRVIAMQAAPLTTLLNPSTLIQAYRTTRRLPASEPPAVLMYR